VAPPVLERQRGDSGPDDGGPEGERRGVHDCQAAGDEHRHHGGPHETCHAQSLLPGGGPVVGPFVTLTGMARANARSSSRRSGHDMYTPPFGRRTCPVMNREASAAR